MASPYCADMGSVIMLPCNVVFWFRWYDTKGNWETGVGEDFRRVDDGTWHIADGRLKACKLVRIP